MRYIPYEKKWRKHYFIQIVLDGLSRRLIHDKLDL